MQMDVGLDTGDMLLKKSIPITQQDTAQTLHDHLAELGGDAMLETLQQLADDKLHAEKQDDAQACYAKKLHKDEAWINWQVDAVQIHRQIRAFVPWPVAQTRYHDDIIRIHAAEWIAATENAEPGEILAYDKNGLLVACKSGQLRIEKCQLPGAKAMSIADLYNGHPHIFEKGHCFSQAE